MKVLLNAQTLEQSSIVANSLMNRERNCAGKNSYAKELFFNLLEYLKERLQTERQVAWLDLCCGSGRALIEAARFFNVESLSTRVKIIGVDLVKMFDSFPFELACLRLVESSVVDFQPEFSFDLITCVHGLHYIGDKLRLIQNASGWLKEDGIFLSNLDLKNLKFENGSQAGRVILRDLRRYGFEYDSSKHLLTRNRRREFNLNYKFIGADDKAGANYTGQAAVDSYYRKIKPEKPL